MKRSEIRGWVSKLSDELAPASVDGCYSRARRAFRAAVDDHLIAEAPCRNVALPEIVVDKIVALTTEQVEALAAAR